jgi:hypothetical protein
MQTNAAGTAAEFASNIDVPGTLDVTGVGTFDANLLFNSGYGSAAVAYGCRAWLNYNATTTVIRGSGNVSSLTNLGVGSWQINFTTPLVDANYSTVGSCLSAAGYNTTVTTTGAISSSATAFTTCGILGSAQTNADSTLVNIAVFR